MKIHSFNHKIIFVLRHFIFIFANLRHFPCYFNIEPTSLSFNMYYEFAMNVLIGPFQEKKEIFDF